MKDIGRDIIRLKADNDFRMEVMEMPETGKACRNAVLKKLLGFFVCCIFAVVSSVLTGAYESGDYTYSLKDGKATITNYEGWHRSLKIPTTLKGYPVVRIGSCAFERCEDLISVQLPEGLQSIGRNAFSKCYDLEKVIIPKSVTAIEAGAFMDCQNLKSIRFAGNTKISFGKSVFQHTRLSSLTIPEGTESLPEKFAYSSSLTKVTIPVSVKTIGENAFTYGSLGQITFKGTVAQWKKVIRKTAWKSKTGWADQEVGSWLGVKVRCKDGIIFRGSISGAAARKKTAGLLKEPKNLKTGASKKEKGNLVLTWKKVSGAAGYVVSCRENFRKDWTVLAVTKGTKATVEYRMSYSAGIPGDTSSIDTVRKFRVQAFDRNLNFGAPAYIKYEYPNIRRHEDGYLIHIGKDYYDPLIRSMYWRTGKNADGFEVEYTVSYIPKGKSSRASSRKTVHKTLKVMAEEDLNRLDLGSYEEFVSVTVKVRPFKKYKNGFIYGASFERAYDDSRYLQQKTAE